MVVSEPAIALEVVEASQPGEVRRLAVQLAKGLGFDETTQGQVAIVAAELANNLVRHAQRGEILLQCLPNAAGGRLEIVALDHGPGIQDVTQSLQDGFSTAGTPGAGLGAVKRLASYFDVHSAVGVGSAIVARIERGQVPFEPFDIGSISTCYPGENVCGDAWAALQRQPGLSLIVADGLGHGALAASAAQAALRIFAERADDDPAEILTLANAALRSTRGAAVALAQIDRERGELRYAGLGNIVALLVADGKARNLVSLNGTVGTANRRVQSFVYPWSAGNTLVMFSDGLASHLRIERHAGLLRRDPTLIAGVLYRDFKRGRDDATIVVARVREDFA